eukprot:gnl/TRDRNA2_/TRDRNA2_174974_c0_seq1.p1 gnl/TRDRNA2_/TRDRNA2_174974_c0~~gnl/TRDRNA2_/TRDRNA2_174974_c0_seq1.p1  ORF type:complete len:149 (-),score=44.41 gnl/TRDRNA2_/TRDRNA2_174974_c0_seq1:52-498(-)
MATHALGTLICGGALGPSSHAEAGTPCRFLREEWQRWAEQRGPIRGSGDSSAKEEEDEAQPADAPKKRARVEYMYDVEEAAQKRAERIERIRERVFMEMSDDEKGFKYVNMGVSEQQAFEMMSYDEQLEFINKIEQRAARAASSTEQH